MSWIIEERFTAERWMAQFQGIQKYEQDILAAAEPDHHVTDGKSWGFLQGKRYVLADVDANEKRAAAVFTHAYKFSLYTAIPTLLLYGCCYFSNRLIPIVKLGAALVVLSAIVMAVAREFFRSLHGKCVAIKAQRNVFLGQIRYKIETLDRTYKMGERPLDRSDPDFLAKRRERAEIIVNLAKGIVFLRKHVLENPNSRTSQYLRDALASLSDDTKAALRAKGPFFKSLLGQPQPS